MSSHVTGGSLSDATLDRRRRRRRRVNVRSPPERVDRVTLARQHLRRGRRVGRLGHDIAGRRRPSSERRRGRSPRQVCRRSPGSSRRSNWPCHRRRCKHRPADPLRACTRMPPGKGCSPSDRWSRCRSSRRSSGFSFVVEAGHATGGDRRRGIGLDASRAAATAAAGRAAATDRPPAPVVPAWPVVVDARLTGSAGLAWSCPPDPLVPA